MVCVAFIPYYFALVIYFAFSIPCDCKIRFGKNENFKIPSLNTEKGKGIWELGDALNKNGCAGV